MGVVIEGPATASSCRLPEDCESTLSPACEQDRIVGIFRLYCAPAAGALSEKPRYRLYPAPKTEKILALNRILASVTAICRPTSPPSWRAKAWNVHLFNQRDIAGILRMIDTLGALGTAVTKA